MMEIILNLICAVWFAIIGILSLLTLGIALAYSK